MSREGLSFVDIAELILKESRQPESVYDLFDKVCVEKQVGEEEKLDLIAQFYADITTSAKFVYVGENTWDLKENQKIDLWEKDGSYYKEYNEVEIPEEYKEKPKPAVVKEKVEEPVVEEVKEVVAEPVVEEPIVVEEEKEEQKPLDMEVVPDSNEEDDEFDDELFDDFDEDKYNEYMDTYEDQYED